MSDNEIAPEDNNIQMISLEGGNKEEASVGAMNSPRLHDSVATVPSGDLSENEITPLESEIQDISFAARGKKMTLVGAMDSTTSLFAGRNKEETLVGITDSPRPHDPVATVLSDDMSEIEIAPVENNIQDISLEASIGKEEPLVGAMGSPRPHNLVATVLSEDLAENENTSMEDNVQENSFEERNKEEIFLRVTDSQKSRDPVVAVIPQDLSENEIALVKGKIQDIPLEDRSMKEKLIDATHFNAQQKAVNDKTTTKEDLTNESDADSTNHSSQFEQPSVSDMTFSPVLSLELEKTHLDAAAGDFPMPCSYSCDSEDHPCQNLAKRSHLDGKNKAFSIKMPPAVHKKELELSETLAVLPDKPPRKSLTERTRRSEPSQIPFHRSRERWTKGSPSRQRRERSRAPSTPHLVETSRSPFYHREKGGRSSTGGSVVSWYTSPGRSCSSIVSPLPPISSVDQKNLEVSPLHGLANSIASPLNGNTKEKDRSPTRDENEANKSNYASACTSPRLLTSSNNSSPLRGMRSLESPPGSPAVTLFSRMPQGAESAVRKLQRSDFNIDDMLSFDTIRVCKNKFVYNLHPKPGPCNRCWALASPAQRIRFKARGSHLCIAKTRSGCDRTCTIFPPDIDNENSAPVRLCRQCFFATHKQENSKLQVYRGNNVKVISSSY